MRERCEHGLIVSECLICEKVTRNRRERFALAALTGYMANKERPTYFHPDDDAEFILRIADALIAKLAQGSQRRD